MIKTKRKNRIFIDLNHPADFHLFKNLIRQLGEEGYTIRITAREKECLHDLLLNEGIPFSGRGRGRSSLAGKYLHGFYVFTLIFFRVLFFRPGITLSLSSPYLILASRLLGISTLCYDDTDINPRLHPVIRLATHIISPVSYPLHFHQNHHRIPVFKELSYLSPEFFQEQAKREGLFFRLTRTDSIHHSQQAALNPEAVSGMIHSLNKTRHLVLSSETRLPGKLSGEVHTADALHIHKDLNRCKAFWGNSATMAAEAAVLGIPAIFVGSEKFSYIKELESYGLLFFYSPGDLEKSFQKLDELLAHKSPEEYRVRQASMLKEKIDLTAFLHWFITCLPGSAGEMESNPGVLQAFTLVK